MHFIKGGLSVDETKISVIILSFIATLGFALWSVVHGGDIPDNVLNLLTYQIIAITGINVADKLAPKKKPEVGE
jgi:hypothetical protein